jgi:TatD DNase family protein
MTIHLIDTHAHLHVSHFDADRDATLERAREAHVVRIVEIGYDLESSRQAVTLAQQYADVFAVVGIQPHYASQADASWLAEIEALSQQPKVVAIGEIGLDYYHDRAPHDTQERLFRDQLALARRLDLPVVIHSRDAHADTLRILQDAARGQPGVMHSFSGDEAYAHACLDVGFYLSFSGPVTYSKATDHHAVARSMPLDRLLIETDSPYLTPNPHRGKRNEPAYVRFVAARIAELRSIPLATLAAAVWQNAERLFQFDRWTQR